MRIVSQLCVALSVIAIGSWGGAAEDELTALLRRAIVGPYLPLAEVQRYCEASVPRIPKIATAQQWQAEAERWRLAVLDRVVYRGAAAGWRDAPAKVEWLDTIPGGSGYRIKKLRYEALPGLWVPALLYEPEKLQAKVPAILNVNGHTHLGKQYPPKQIRCINQAKRGMLALNIEWVGMGQLSGGGYSHARMNQLDLCGTSGLAPFYLNMKRGLDVLLGLEHADPTRVAVTGLSGGGWQTVVFSALEPRVTLSNPVAGYSSFLTRARHFKDLGDSEQTPNDLATFVDYTHLTAMRAPKPTLLTYNSKDDCCFESGYALPPLVDAAAPIFELFGKRDALRTHVNDVPGTHNFEVDNRQALYRMLGAFFYAGDKQFDAKEIPSDAEVKTEEQLRVPLPSPNEDFHTLALALAKQLPRQAALPMNRAEAEAWQGAARKQLRDIVRTSDEAVAVIDSTAEKTKQCAATLWRLRVGEAWTVPVVELVPSQPSKVALLVADAGRAGAAADITALLASGHRVLAVDPFYFGESKIAQRDWLFALLVTTVGGRPLGIQAGQVAAIARWAAARQGVGPVTVVAVGPRSSTFALVAAALETKAIQRVELRGALGSLKEVIEQNAAVSDKPELFCFGLLEAFDIKQLAALVAPRPVQFAAPSDRVKQETSDLRAWFQLLGGKFE